MSNPRIQNVRPQEYQGKKFRSTLEAQTAQALDRMGIPYSYEERKIELIPGFRTPFQKEKVRSVTYTPDFIIGPIMLECKGFETPEWKLKRKILFKWLKENEPFTIFYQIHDAGKSLLKALDRHWAYLEMQIECTSKKGEKHVFDSVECAMLELGFEGRAWGPIMNSLVGDREYVYGYKWKLIKN